MKRVDLLILGATGYTGQYLVKQLASISKNEMISWAVAGRSKQKLDNVLDSVSKQTSNFNQI